MQYPNNWINPASKGLNHARQINHLEEQLDGLRDKGSRLNNKMNHFLRLNEENPYDMHEFLKKTKGLDAGDVVIQVEHQIRENAEKIKELEKQRKELLSYVTVMPHTHPIEDPNVLTPDEIYALNTQGFRRDEKQESEIPTSPPPAKPGGNHEKLGLHTGGTPDNQVIADRLNSSERFEDMIRKWVVGSQSKLNDTLNKAQDKTGLDLARKVVDDREEDRKRQLNQLDQMKKATPQMEAYSNWISNRFHS